MGRREGSPYRCLSTNKHRRRELENKSQFGNHRVMMEPGKSHEWTAEPGSEHLMKNSTSEEKPSPHKILINDLLINTKSY